MHLINPNYNSTFSNRMLTDNYLKSQIGHIQTIWKGDSLKIGDLPLPNTEFYIMTVSTETKSQKSPPFQLSLSFKRNPCPKDAILEVKSDRAMVCSPYFFSYEGTNFVFIKLRDFSGFISKMLISADHHIKIKGISHIYFSNLCWPYNWFKTFSDRILKNEIPCDFNIHYYKLESNSELIKEKDVCKILPYTLEIPPPLDPRRQNASKDHFNKQLASRVTEQVFQTAFRHQDGLSRAESDNKKETPFANKKVGPR